VVTEGKADLVRSLTFPFPLVVIAGMLDLPDDELDRFHRLAVEMISVSFDMDLALRASGELGAWFTGWRPSVGATRSATSSRCWAGPRWTALG